MMVYNKVDILIKYFWLISGDIAFKMLDKLTQQDAKAYKKQDTEIIISDINQAMLDVGKQRAKRMKIDKGFFSLC